MTTLSSKKIAALKPREKRYSIADGNGLTLRVMPSGKKIWYLRTSSSSRVADKKLGEYPDMNLAQARQKARRLRKDIGLEPPKGYVLKDAFRLWCRLKKPQIVSYLDERRRLERYRHFWIYEERLGRLHHCRRGICLFFRGVRIYGKFHRLRTGLEYVCNSV